VYCSAVLVCLGWGLRGYIGGGPLGAMIPGAFLALWLCLLLGIGGHRAAVITVFSAVGMGFGGEMTYGQTLGFLRSDETLWWGILGTVVKGGVWGLLAGIVIGLGFVVQRLSLRQVATTLGIFLVAVVLGIALINQPKLIYFSDPINKPRAEIWAGLLFGAVALLWRLRALGVGGLPTAFAAWGVVGGMLGFGLGGGLMALGDRLPEPWHSGPWWKFMEFNFGAWLGLVYGACSLRHREALLSADNTLPAVTPTRPVWSLALPLALFTGVALVGWNYTAEPLLDASTGWPLLAISKPIGMVLLGYCLWGTLLMLASLRWETIAWQTGITITFLATVMDLQDDLAQENGLHVAALWRAAFVIVALLITVAGVLRWQSNPQRRLAPLLLALMWGCMAVAYSRLIVYPTVLTPTPEQIAEIGGFAARFAHVVAQSAIVHGIFTACAVCMSVALWLHREDNNTKA